ncbi:type I toxin-antitoxin system Fst family toxin [Mammaliicoccus sciuri]|nr:type I toxin-antitoxin system Fst family toxin [Mammaliicoccus sciuri]MEB7784213.1 type I toxin-antitoxin system Fst family toxin [Mammaliicoccus sciuri]
MLDVLFVTLIAPTITGVIIAIFTHWLNKRKK